MRTSVSSVAVSRGSFRDSLVVQFRIIGALAIREAMARYGHEHLGFFWVMGEPLLLTCGVMALWALGNVTQGTGVSVVPFALSAYTMLTLWRHISLKAQHSMRQNIGLVFHQNVKFLDILVARAMLETVGILAAFFIAYVPLALFGVVPLIHDPLALLGAWFMIAWFSFGFAMIIASLTELSEAADRFINPIMYLTLPATGAFFMVYWLPEDLRPIALLSPLINGSEMFRSGLFPPDIPTQWSASYLFWWCVVMTAIGLPMVLYAQKRVELE